MTIAFKPPYQRNRSQGRLSSGAIYYDIGAGPVANYTTSQGPGAAVGKTRVMTDVVTPGFRILSKQGVVLFRPMQVAEVEHKPAQTTSVVSRQLYPAYAAGQTYTGMGDQVSKLVGGSNLSTTAIPSNMMPISILSESAKERAISEACTKAQRFPSDANLLVSIAEVHKTMRLVPDLWTNWSRFFQSFHGRVEYRYGRNLTIDTKRQSVANLRALQRVAEETWLAMRFGVRPLIMDTVGVVKALATSLHQGPFRLTSRGQVVLTGSDVQTAEYSSGIYLGTIVTSHTQNLVVRAMSLFEVAEDSYSMRTGLAIGQVPEAVIDLIRFSFVLNWVVSLNDYFAALGAQLQPGVRSLGGCYTLLDERVRVMQHTGGRLTDTTNYTLDSSPFSVGTVSTRNKSRIVGLRAPTISLRAEPFKFLTDFRLLDAIALMSSTTRRMKQTPLRFM